MCVHRPLRVAIAPPQWQAQPVTDMFADALVAGVLAASALPAPKHLPLAPKLDRMHFKVAPPGLVARTNIPPSIRFQEYFLFVQNILKNRPFGKVIF